MSINDLLEQGIEIEGKYAIEVWDNEREEYSLGAIGEFYDDIRRVKKEYLDAEITHIYASNFKGAILTFEIQL